MTNQTEWAISKANLAGQQIVAFTNRLGDPKVSSADKKEALGFLKKELAQLNEFVADINEIDL